MKNPFEHHEVGHLSASSINEYISNPQRWLLHVSGYRDNIGIPAMWRGTAVDKAITKAIELPTLSTPQIIQWAENFFDDLHNVQSKEKIFIDEAKAQNEKLALSKYLTPAIPHFRKLGKPIDSQKKIKLELDDVDVPIIGYLDLLYEDCVRDIKTVNRLPSTMMDSISRQLSIYGVAEQKKPIVDYVHATKTNSQVVVREVHHIDYHIKVVKKAAYNMGKILSISNDIAEIANLLIPDLDDWKWSNGERQAARQLWRI